MRGGASNATQQPALNVDLLCPYDPLKQGRFVLSLALYLCRFLLDVYPQTAAGLHDLGDDPGVRLRSACGIEFHHPDEIPIEEWQDQRGLNARSSGRAGTLVPWIGADIGDPDRLGSEEEVPENTVIRRKPATNCLLSKLLVVLRVIQIPDSGRHKLFYLSIEEEDVRDRPAQALAEPLEHPGDLVAHR